MAAIARSLWKLAHKLAGHPSDESTRPMKYPYTFTAKIVQFPYGYYFKYSWVYRYYLYGVIVSFPVFVYIHRKGKLL